MHCKNDKVCAIVVECNLGALISVWWKWKWKKFNFQGHISNELRQVKFLSISDLRWKEFFDKIPWFKEKLNHRLNKIKRKSI